MLFITKHRVQLAESDADPGRFDPIRQLWEDAAGVPVVLADDDAPRASKYGETRITETREGKDQSEGRSPRASQYGETLITKSHEGKDQSEGRPPLRASQYGESTVTKTHEGTDQSEGRPPRASKYGETMLTRTHEGKDQSEGGARGLSHLLRAPFVAAARQPSLESDALPAGATFGPDQIWRLPDGRPVVLSMPPSASTVGETRLTASREGKDQNENGGRRTGRAG